MEMVKLSASARSADERANQMRRAGKVPGVVYGNIANTLLSFDGVALTKAYNKAGESTLVELDMDGKKLPVLFHEITLDPVSDRMTHVDFYAVDMKKETDAEVRIRFEGESPAVKEGAVFVTALHEVTVRCLPANLPHDLAANISKLVEVGSTLKVSDLEVPEGVTVLNDAETVIAIAQEQRAEEVVEVAVEAAPEAAAPGPIPGQTEGASAPAKEEKKDEKK